MVLKNEFPKDKPLLTTSVVADILKITPDRLRTYDNEGLIKTHRQTRGQIQKRLYSLYDVEWLESIRELVKTHKMSISSLKFLLKVIYNNPNVLLPTDEIGCLIKEMTKNPNFTTVVKDF